MPNSHSALNFADATRQGRMRNFGSIAQQTLFKKLSMIEQEIAIHEDCQSALKTAAIEAVSLGWNVSGGLCEGLQFSASNEKPALSLAVLEALLSLDAPPSEALIYAIPPTLFNTHTGVSYPPDFDRVNTQLAQMRLLLAHGANPNQPDDDGRTALHHAATRNAPTQFFTLLIEAGADLEAKTLMGSTARDFIRNMFSNNAAAVVEMGQLQAYLDKMDAEKPTFSSSSDDASLAPRRFNRI